MILYPTVDEVIATHALLIARFGGSQGIRDRGALEIALDRHPMSAESPKKKMPWWWIWLLVLLVPIQSFLLPPWYMVVTAFAIMLGALVYFAWKDSSPR